MIAPVPCRPESSTLLLEQAAFADDELVAEYLGGVVASSRSEIGRDDRAAAIAATIGRLSAYALPTHYIFYAAARPHFTGVDLRSGGADRDAQVYVSMEQFYAAMDFSEHEDALLNDILGETLFALTRENLIQEQWAIGNRDGLRGLALVDAPAAGIVYRLSNPGVILFVAAREVRIDALGRYAESSEFPAIPDIEVPTAVLPRPLPPFSVPDHPPAGP